MDSLYYLKKSSSTNEEIVNFLQENTLPFLGVYTFNQTRGKGQYGNSWEAPENLNISYSLAVKKEDSQRSHQLFNFRTALILRDFIAKLTKTDVAVKWPNDLIIKDKKVSGILIEAKKVKEENYLIVGIGINVLQKSFPDFPRAGSLFSQTGRRFDLEETSQKLHEYFVERLKETVPDDQILEEFNTHLFRKGKISVFEIKEVRQNGINRFADEEGFLHVELENDGLKKFFHKEIELLY
ncbi:biotin--[acetyl-CoA-carboxylase] ligase [Chryseobacterium sp.]|uniref:biotin--[acetyl-CoA-carboxylase] ligase n=1 Tax=Chryseobacterium sp. TaxID=1871047 RepID=UPI0011CC4A9C|nr:biotin--[acetyl-CoA-carboxylase] ligase [Chryseobacterium sp.]TXF76114.1 biotin--[acetyl-CoA-carboxylase] ligase [Chryseobacterium sp.]